MADDINITGPAGVVFTKLQRRRIVNGSTVDQDVELPTFGAYDFTGDKTLRYERGDFFSSNDVESFEVALYNGNTRVGKQKIERPLGAFVGDPAYSPPGGISNIVKTKIAADDDGPDRYKFAFQVTGLDEEALVGDGSDILRVAYRVTGGDREGSDYGLMEFGVVDATTPVDVEIIMGQNPIKGDSSPLPFNSADFLVTLKTKEGSFTPPLRTTLTPPV